MNAIVLEQFGPPHALRWARIADPEPGAGQLRIRVAAAGVHRIDTWIRAGAETPATVPLPVLPWVPGREVAGEVDAVGPGVDPVWLGRCVAVHLGAAGGGYAERAVCALEAVHVVPARLDAAAAVAMIGTGRTALAVIERAGITPEDVVLVTGAAGGAGDLVVQYLGRVVGATVVGAARGVEKLASVREAGATLAVDYGRPGWTREVATWLDGRGVSVVLDAVGGTRGREALELLTAGGRFVVFGWASGCPTPLGTEDLAPRGLTVTAAVGPALALRAGGLRALQERALAEAAAGRVRPRIQRFALRDAAAAHAALEARRVVGKVVLLP